MIGAGTQRAGTTGGGLGEVDLPAVPPTPESGAPYISIQGNYEFDAYTGDIKRETAGRHAVLMAARTKKGSAAADPNFGLHMPQKMDADFEANTEQSFRDSIAGAVKDGTVRLDEITTEQLSRGRAEITIGFTELHPTTEIEGTT